MIFALLHAALGWWFAFLACCALRRRSASSRCWAWRLGLLKGPFALLWTVPIVVAAPIVATTPRPPVVASVETPLPHARAETLPEPSTKIRPFKAHQEPLDVLPWLYVAGVLAVALARLTGARRVRRGMPRVEGVVRPRVVVPAGLTREESAMAFAHETAHVRRRDPQWSFVADLVCAGLWFAPPVWLCARAMRAEAEAACDAAALAETGARKKDYAHLLLAFAGPAPANALGGPARRLARRIVMLDQPTTPLPRFAVAGLLALGLVVLLPWRAEARPPQAMPPSTQEGRIVPFRVEVEAAMESILASPNVRRQIGWTPAQDAALWSRYRRWNAVWSAHTARSEAYKRTHSLNESIRFDSLNEVSARRRADAAAGPMPWSQTQQARLKALALRKYGAALWGDEEVARRLALAPSQQKKRMTEEFALLRAVSDLVPRSQPLPKRVHDLVVWTTAKYFTAAPKDRPALRRRIDGLVARHRKVPVVSRERERAILSGPQAWKLRAETNRRLEAALTPEQLARLRVLTTGPSAWLVDVPDRTITYTHDLTNDGARFDSLLDPTTPQTPIKEIHRADGSVTRIYRKPHAGGGLAKYDYTIETVHPGAKRRP